MRIKSIMSWASLFTCDVSTVTTVIIDLDVGDHSWKKDHQFNWNEKKVIDKEIGWTARKIKETIYSVNNKNHINSTSYHLPDMRLPGYSRVHL